MLVKVTDPRNECSVSVTLNSNVHNLDFNINTVCKTFIKLCTKFADENKCYARR